MRWNSVKFETQSQRRYNVQYSKRQETAMAETNEQELVRKVKWLVRSRFMGDDKRAFDHYARKRGFMSQIDRDEIVRLLQDADVGNAFTRGAWASGVMKRLDTNRDSFISYVEFQTLFDLTR